MLVCIFQHHGSHLGHSSEIFSIWGLNWDDFPYKEGSLVAELNVLTPGTIGFICFLWYIELVNGCQCMLMNVNGI